MTLLRESAHEWYTEIRTKKQGSAQRLGTVVDGVTGTIWFKHSFTGGVVAADVHLAGAKSCA